MKKKVFCQFFWAWHHFARKVVSCHDTLHSEMHHMMRPLLTFKAQLIIDKHEHDVKRVLDNISEIKLGFFPEKGENVVVVPN